jgi:hypothetical protein
MDFTTCQVVVTAECLVSGVLVYHWADDVTFVEYELPEGQS